MIATARRSWPALLAAAALAASWATPARAATKTRPSPWTFHLGAEGELRYDDNIIGLSEDEIDLVDDPSVDPIDRFGVESEDDVIFAPDVLLSLSREPGRGFETDVALTLRAYDYFRNSKKDYQQYVLSVRQALNRSRKHRTVLAVGSALIPSYFLRRLVDDDESAAIGATVRNDAAYRMSSGYVEFDQEIVNRTLSVTGRYALERRDYDDHFDERDASSDVFSLDVDIYPMRSIGFRIQPYYERQSRSTRGDLAASTTVTDDDVGFDSDLAGVDLRWLWGPDRDHRNVVNFFAQMETRDFASEDPSDTGHFGREDDITKFGAGYTREVGPSWKWGASAYHRENESSKSSGTTTFTKNVVTVALSYRFESRPRGEPDDRE